MGPTVRQWAGVSIVFFTLGFTVLTFILQKSEDLSASVLEKKAFPIITTGCESDQQITPPVRLTATFPLVNSRLCVIRDRSDGIGAQLHARINALIESQFKGDCQYVHRPISGAEWGVNIIAAEALFNLGAGEIRLGDIPDDIALEEIPGNTSVIDSHPNLLDLYRPQLISKYRSGSSKPIITEFKRNAINVAVHVRMGWDVDACQTIDHVRSRCIPNHYTISKLENLSTEIAKRTDIPLNVIIFTQGRPDQMSEFNSSPFHIVYDADPLYTVHALVSADILLMAHSSYSYLAASLSEGLVVYDRFWHPPARSWVEYDEVFQWGVHHEIQLQKVLYRVQMSSSKQVTDIPYEGEDRH